MENYLERIEQAMGMSRRSFVKASTAAVASLAAVGLVGCSNKVEPSGEDADVEAMSVVGSDGRDVITGEWITAACWHNCGGRCVNKALVRDGVVVRQKTDDSSEDSLEEPQQRSCSRGHSQRNQVFAADRLKYPMKRKNWSPDDPHGELRGKDEWERISWDEAFKYVGDELKKAVDAYGPNSILMLGGAITGRVINELGGATSITDTSSFGVYSTDLTMLGMDGNDYRVANDRFDMENADYIVFQGANPYWSGHGLVNYRFMQMKKNGSTFVVIGPDSNVTCQALDARWIPVRSGTDMAFLLGVAYEMLKLDEEKGGIVDWDFLHTYAVGFDDESMPEGATGENLKGYLLGSYDNTPKTAEWASEICGTPVEDIRWYAEILGKENAVTMLHGYAPARCTGAEDMPQMFMSLAAMGGHIGKPGHCCGSTTEYAHGNGGPMLVNPGDGGLPVQDTVTVDDAIPAPVAWQSILDKKYIYNGVRYAFMAPAEERNIDIHVIFNEASGGMQTTPDLMKAIEVMRSVDFVFTNAQFLKTQAKYSDIVLPCTTEWETPGGFAGSGDREYIYVYRQVVEPLYEAKTDQEIGRGIAEAMGLDADSIYPLSEKQQFMNKLLGSTIVQPDGKTTPLLTVTQDDLSAWECEGAPQEGAIGLNEFLEKGFYHVARSKDDKYGYIAYKDFIDDPTANPLPSESGKFEIYCQAKADSINNAGFSSSFKPYPTYQVPVLGAGSAVSGEYPFLCTNPHYYRTAHSSMDNVMWLCEAWTRPVFLNASDAEAKGVVDGDTVRVFNQFGSVLRQATLLETLMPGQVALPHGAWIDLDENEENDLAGADNVLCGTVGDGMTVSGYNNYNVDFEKYDGEPIVPDYERPQRIVEL